MLARARPFCALLQEQQRLLTDAQSRLDAAQVASMPPPQPRQGQRRMSQQQQQQQPPPGSEPSADSAGTSAASLSAPVTLSDRQHRTAAALLASLGQTAARGRERLARLERVLGAMAGDAAEPERVRVPALVSRRETKMMRRVWRCPALCCVCVCVCCVYVYRERGAASCPSLPPRLLLGSHPSQCCTSHIRTAPSPETKRYSRAHCRPACLAILQQTPRWLRRFVLRMPSLTPI